MRRILPVVFAILAAFGLNARDCGDNEVQVRGRLIDVRTITVNGTFFPQNKKSVIGKDLVAFFGKGTEYAVSLMEYRGPEQVRCGRNEKCRIALDADTVLPKPWRATGESFSVCSVTYYIYENARVRTGEWTDIPYPDGCAHSAVVFGTSVSVADVPEFGTIVHRVPKIRKCSAYNQTIAMLPDGSYLAACTSTGEGTVMYRSQDKGRNWERFGNYSSSENLIGNYHNLFVHRGSVYLMGVGPGREGLRISRSDDGGRTWSVPEDSTCGLILPGKYHTAPVPVLVSGGRIWRACETYPDKDPFVLSAPGDCDLLDASNWTRTNTVGPASTLVDGFKMSGSMIEGNVVEAPDGSVVNIIRTNSNRTSNYATILHVRGIDTLRFNPKTDWVRMPGGGKKFTVRYDPVSGLYWSLTNPDIPEDVSHQGLGYKTGLSHSLMRNRLVLICSPDLVNWDEVRTVLYDPDPFFHGFQYADWVFDGDDIAAVVRVGAPESRGLPVRQHDSNLMIFVRVTNFRNNE